MKKSNIFTLYDFLKLFNFRKTEDDKFDTDIIRIYHGLPDCWIEFGMENFGSDQIIDKQIKACFRPDYLQRKVESIDSQLGYVSVYLEEKDD